MTRATGATATGAPLGRTARSRAGWVALVVVAVALLAIGVIGDRAPQTEAARVQAIASEVKCPTCQGLSAAESDAIAAEAVRDAIRDGIRAGQSDGQIRAFLVSRYGEGVLLKPKASGFSALVWVLPVAGLIVALVALGFAFRRWKDRPAREASEEDTALVEAALSAPAER